MLEDRTEYKRRSHSERPRAVAWEKRKPGFRPFSPPEKGNRKRDRAEKDAAKLVAKAEEKTRKRQEKEQRHREKELEKIRKKEEKQRKRMEGQPKRGFFSVTLVWRYGFAVIKEDRGRDTIATVRCTEVTSG
ncbi:unnamed protein product, partial [Mesorhabditis spiculigera]